MTDEAASRQRDLLAAFESLAPDDPNVAEILATWRAALDRCLQASIALEQVITNAVVYIAALRALA